MTDRPRPAQVLGDPRVPWIVLLEAQLGRPAPSRDALSEALSRVAAEAGWPPPGPAAVRTGSRRDLLGELCTGSEEVLRVGAHGHGLVLAARHDALDGLGMLTALDRVLGEEVRSSVRGVESAGRTSPPAGALLARAWEIALRPPARVARSSASAVPGDSFAAATVDAMVRTADLVHSGARAISTWNRRHSARTRRVSVAVGVSTAGGVRVDLADRSAFLRLQAVERMTLAEVRHHLAHAPLQLGGFVAAPPRGLAAAARLGLRMAAPRLGSTLLVSHLGTIQAPDQVDALSFYPVTGGGSGLSLGAATLHGRTTITLRARGSQHDDEGLQGLLALVVEELGTT